MSNELLFFLNNLHERPKPFLSFELSARPVTVTGPFCSGLQKGSNFKLCSLLKII